ncbi:MAG: hypothetical protein DHS20C01_38620 [marine bacterium B5-7]|nr:MAG: hypothetical protein DHS20C01_38620 [marine bacterium B5-7]
MFELAARVLINPTQEVSTDINLISVVSGVDELKFLAGKGHGLILD